MTCATQRKLENRKENANGERRGKRGREKGMGAGIGISAHPLQGMLFLSFFLVQGANFPGDGYGQPRWSLAVTQPRSEGSSPPPLLLPDPT